ncbi:proproteinase E-like [Salvelinus alpinus]
MRERAHLAIMEHKIVGQKPAGDTESLRLWHTHLPPQHQQCCGWGRSSALQLAMAGFHTYRVVVAEHDMNTEEGYEESIMVGKMILHPDWNDNCVSCGNDIALLKLVRSAVINDKVQLACLPENGAILTHNQPCYVTGWGRIYSGGAATNHLQQALLPVVEHSVCSHSDWWGSSAKTTMICAGGESKSASHGDSGGPLNCQGRW